MKKQGARKRAYEEGAMQDGHNDYVILTKTYLKDYKRLSGMRDVWLHEMHDINSELAETAAAPIAQYGGEPGGGSGLSTPTERAAEHCMRLGTKRDERAADCAEVARLAGILQTALAAMEPEDAELLRMHYIEGLTWYDVGDKLGYSYQGIRKRGSRALHTLTQYIFGLKAVPPRQIVLIA